MSTDSKQIDAHHHLWRYTATEFGWINDAMAVLRRDFLVTDFASALQSSQVGAAVTVQARESLVETDWLLKCAQATSLIAGVVGWAPLDSPDIPSILDSYAAHPKLVGFRDIAQGQPEGFLDRPGFNKGISVLTAREFAYDVLICERQLPEALRLIDRHPNQRFILDHAAKPRIAAGELEPWAANIRELARRANVSCKLSGLVTEANWTDWSPAILRPYLDICVEAFGPDRVMAASDWPVCLVASSHSRWWGVLRDYFAGFSRAEQNRVFGGNAVQWYQLSV